MLLRPRRHRRPATLPRGQDRCPTRGTE
jgi:hypothetical protein